MTNQNNLGTVVVMTIPTTWLDVYNELLNYLANMGIDLLTECNASCKGSNKEYLACWNMFQVACAIYNNAGEETSETDTLLHFIRTKLGINNRLVTNDEINSDNNNDTQLQINYNS